MHPFFVVFMVMLITLAVAVFSLARSSTSQRRDGQTVDDLRARIRTLEAIITDQDRKLRRDFDGLA
ncbi:MAG: hypothetical protein AAGH87_05800 [Pseudomonadota bacterium]